MNSCRPPLAIIALLLLCLNPAPGQSLGMLLEVGLVPGLGGEMLRLAEGPITGGAGVDLALVPPGGDLPPGVLLGSSWGDLVFYAGSPGQLFQPPQVWLGAGAAQWEWPPRARQTSPELVDWDGDGNLDLLLGWGPLLLWYPRQDGNLGAGQQVRTAEGQPLTRIPGAAQGLGGHLSPCIGDLDGDGRPDLLLGAENGTLWWAQNQADRGFSLGAPRPIVGPTGPLRVTSRARPAFGDLTGDGRGDLLVGDGAGRLWLWPGMPTGLGPGRQLAFTSPPEPPLSGPLAPRCLPAPGQILLGETGGFVRWVELGADGSLTDRGRLMGRDVPLDVGLQPAISAVDHNGDGRLDLLAGEASGRVWLFENSGFGADWSLSAARPVMARGEPVEAEGGYSWPLLADVDRDGDLDLLLGTGSGRLELWLHTSELTPGIPLNAGAGPIQAAGPLTVATLDWNRNGRLDLLLGCRQKPAVEADNIQVHPDQVAYFQNESRSPRGMPVFTKGTPLDLYWRHPGADGSRGRLPAVGLSLMLPLPSPRELTQFLGLGRDATFLFACDSRPPLYPMLTLSAPGSPLPAGILPALSSLWVTADAAGRPDQVLCGLAEYGMVCVFPARSLGLQ